MPTRRRVQCVLRRGNVLYFRKAVPAALVAQIGKREFKLSLRTSDPVLARIRSRALSNLVDAMTQDRTGQPVTFDALQDALRTFFQRQLNRSLELSHDLPDDRELDLDSEIEGLHELVRSLRHKLARQRFSGSDLGDAAELIAAMGGSATADHDRMTTACNGVLRAKIENARILAAMLSGRHDLTSPLDPLFSGMAPDAFPAIPGELQPLAGTSVGAVVAQYRAFKSRTWVKKTVADQERVFQLTFEIVGANKPIASVGPDDVRAMRDALARIPKNYMKAAATRSLTAREAIASADPEVAGLSLKTQDKYLSMFRSLLIWASDEGIIDQVPGRGVKVASVGRVNPIDRRYPYSSDQLQRIFASPLYRGHAPNHRSKPGNLMTRDGRFWAPLIALFSGLRMGEIVQLLATDVRCEQGVWYLDVTSLEGKSLKGPTSRRRVPIHSELVEIGLLHHHAKVGKGRRLFADIDIGATGSPSHSFSKWWNRYSLQAGFKEPRTVFHSFRHSFKDALVATDATEYVAKALLGHSDRSAHASYGSGPSLASLKAAVDRVTYPIDLAHLQA